MSSRCRSQLHTGPDHYRDWLADIDIGQPDWDIEVVDGPALAIGRPIPADQVRDVVLGPGDTARFNGRALIKLDLSFDEFVECVHFAVLWTLEHEANEHFRVSGGLRYDPHVPGAVSKLVVPYGLFFE